MTQFPSQQTIAAARKLHESLATDNLPPLIAKLYSQHARLQQRQPGLTNWRGGESEVRLSEAIRLIEAALLERDSGLSDWRIAMRRAGELMEWLAHPALNRHTLPLHLMAAAAYQISGYPARSGSLLSQDYSDGSESAIVKSFLKADFPVTLRNLCDYWVIPQTLLTTDATQSREDIGLAVVPEIASAIGVLCADMRWGDDGRRGAALAKLDSAAKLMLFGRDSYSAVLARMCYEVAAVYRDNSLRNAVAGLVHEVNSTGKLAIERYVRMSFQDLRSLAWPSQRSGIAQIIAGGNFALCTPTGSGKTSVAELAILRALFPTRYDAVEPQAHPLVLYVVPSRALAGEVEARLSRVVSWLGREVPITVTGLYGGTDWGPTDAWLTSDQATVLICTYEKADALIRFLGPLFLHRLMLLIIDEAHAVNDSGDAGDLARADSRPLRLETLCARVLPHIDANLGHAIALSAVAAGTDDVLANWITGQPNATAARTYYRSTRQLVGRLECGGGGTLIRYDLLDGASLRFDDEGDGSTLYIPSPFPPVPTTTGYVGPQKSLRPYLFWAAIHLARPDDEIRPSVVLISITQQLGGYAQDFLDLLEKQWRGTAPVFFDPPSDGERLNNWRECLAICEDYFGKTSREYRLLSLGVVVHHGKLPGLLPRKLIALVKAGVIRIVLATSTLSEGVNLPFDTVLIPTLQRYPQSMPVQEFANVVGRAGRPGVAIEGKCLVLIPQGEKHTREVLEEYRKLIRGMLQQRQAGSASADSPLARLIVHIEAAWHRINHRGSEAQFEA